MAKTAYYWYCWGVSSVYVSLNLYSKVHKLLPTIPKPIKRIVWSKCKQEHWLSTDVQQQTCWRPKAVISQSTAFSWHPSASKTKRLKTKRLCSVRFNAYHVPFSEPFGRFLVKLAERACIAKTATAQQVVFVDTENPCNFLSFNFLLFESALLFMKYRIGSSETEPREYILRLLIRGQRGDNTP